VFLFNKILREFLSAVCHANGIPTPDEMDALLAEGDPTAVAAYNEATGKVEGPTNVLAFPGKGKPDTWN
jgi:hypothetical protein